jgi:glycosyltransferase involved in cell wall biosynthesis
VTTAAVRQRELWEAGALCVLHVSQPIGVGVPDYVAELVRDQLRRGWRIAVASPPAERPLREAVQAAGAEHFEWRADRRPERALGRELVRLREIVTAAGPDLVHLHSSVAGLVGRLLLRARIPTVFQPHSWSFHALSPPLKSVGVAWERLGARWADEIFCVSEHERFAGEEAGIRARWRVIKNGVDLGTFSKAGPEERDLARARLGLPRVTPVAVCVARLTHQKGQDILVDAWPSVRSQIPDARLYLVGDGPEEEHLRQRAPAGVVVAGHRDDVSDWLAAADVVALPSRWEGMSLAMLEAMARGRSIVATDVGGAREVIGTKAGAIVEGRPEALAAAIGYRLAHPEVVACEGRSAREIVARSHDVHATLDAVAAAYGEVLGRRAAGVARLTTLASVRVRL